VAVLPADDRSATSPRWPPRCTAVTVRWAAAPVSEGAEERLLLCVEEFA
jgi:hypothetical protein